MNAFRPRGRAPKPSGTSNESPYASLGDVARFGLVLVSSTPPTTDSAVSTSRPTRSFIVQVHVLAAVVRRDWPTSGAHGPLGADRKPGVAVVAVRSLASSK